MKRDTSLLAAIAFCAACSALFADYAVRDRGMWPTNWPAELEPLRKVSRTLEGPLVPQLHYEIPFTKREDFEGAWPHLLKVKSKGAAIVLVRGPNRWLGATVKAGVRVHAPPARADVDEPLPGQADRGGRGIRTTHIELVVDGEIVDLNRIPLPADTPIIDERFKDAAAKRP